MRVRRGTPRERVELAQLQRRGAAVRVAIRLGVNSVTNTRSGNAALCTPRRLRRQRGGSLEAAMRRRETCPKKGAKASPLGSLVYIRLIIRHCVFGPRKGPVHGLWASA